MITAPRRIGPRMAPGRRPQGAPQRRRSGQGMRRAGAVPLLGEAVLGRPRRVLACAGLLLVVAAVVAGPVLGRLSRSAPTIRARRALRRATRSSGRRAATPTTTSWRSCAPRRVLRSPAGRAAIAAVARVLAADRGVAAVRGGGGATGVLRRTLGVRRRGAARAACQRGARHRAPRRTAPAGDARGGAGGRRGVLRPGQRLGPP